MSLSLGTHFLSSLLVPPGVLPPRDPLATTDALSWRAKGPAVTQLLELLLTPLGHLLLGRLVAAD